MIVWYEFSYQIEGKSTGKIIRNRFYVENDTAQQILDHLSDLIGFIIECRFIEDWNFMF